MSFTIQSPQNALIKRPLAKAITLLAFGLSFNTQAQDMALDEIIITSQKRPQSLQDVPISVAAITGDKIEKMGVENLEDLTSFVPNIHFTETGLSTQVRIRGIGSDNSQGFEQSVGMYVDGIYHGRAQLFRAPIFDMERVEIMRGPQATLFGKNSIAGALDLITAKPTDEFEGKVSANYENEFATKEVTGVLSGPLNERLKGRLAVRYYDDPGYMQNISKGTTEPSSRENAIRASLDWDITDDLSALLIAEHDTFKVNGRAIEMTLDLPNATAADPRFGLSFSQILSLRGINDGNTQDYNRHSNSAEFSDNTIDAVTFRLDYNLDDYTLTALTGILGYDYTENCDCDFTSGNIFNLDLEEEYDQISQEIRLASPDDGLVTWVAGLFYQSYEQSFADVFNIPSTSLLPTILAQTPGLPADTVSALPLLSGTGIAREFQQDSSSWAVFGETTFNITDNFKIAVGARFTEETKDADKELNSVDIMDNNAILNPATDPVRAGTVGALFQGFFVTDTQQGAGGHSLTQSRSESAFTPSITASWYVNDDMMLYAKVNKGFKAGGFDPRSNNNANFEFEEEKVIATELGSKMTVADGRGEINLALFNMDYKNLQVSQFDGALGFNVGNAKDTTVMGLEMDGRWKLSSHLSAQFGFAYLDFEYKDFKNGNCYFGQPTDETGFCDYTGKSGVYTPKYTINASLNYEKPLSGDMDFISNLAFQQVDSQMVHVNLDPEGEINAYSLLSLRIGVETYHWSLALLGSNLLNEDILTYSGNMPLSGSMAGTNSHYSFIRRPRTFTLSASYSF